MARLLFLKCNASSIRGILQSEDVLRENPDAVCIVGAFDSLLAKGILDWFEKDQRLKSESFGRNQGGHRPRPLVFLSSNRKNEPTKTKHRSLQKLSVNTSLMNRPRLSLTPRLKGKALSKK